MTLDQQLITLWFLLGAAMAPVSWGMTLAAHGSRGLAAVFAIITFFVPPSIFHELTAYRDSGFRLW